MSIPGSANGCFNPLIYLHGNTIINGSGAYDSSTAWPQFHIELISMVFRIELIVTAGLVPGMNRSHRFVAAGP